MIIRYPGNPSAFKGTSSSASRFSDRRAASSAPSRSSSTTVAIAPDACTISAAITAESVVIEGTVEGPGRERVKILVHSTAEVEGECCP
jgi:hypothetical protein